MIDLNELMKTARQKKDSAALVGYQSVYERTLRAMSTPGPRQGQPLTEAAIKILIHDEIKERQDSNEFMAPSQDSYAKNNYIIQLLAKLVRG